MNSKTNKIQQVKSLRNGKGVQYLLNAVYAILGNPIYVYDIEYKLMGYTDNIITDDPLWNELITTGIHGEESIEFFKNECFIDAIANAKTVTYLISEKIKYDRMLGKIKPKNNITVAFAGIVACNKPFEDDTPMIFEVLCKKLSKEIGEKEFYQTYGKAHQERIICDLVCGCIRDKRLCTHFVAEIYAGLKNYLYIAIADISDPKLTQLEYFKNIFSLTQPAFKYAIYDGRIIIIISSDENTINAGRSLRKLEKLIKENNIHIGISGSFENLYESHKYYLEALNTLNSGSKCADNRQISFM